MISEMIIISPIKHQVAWRALDGYGIISDEVPVAQWIEH
jgi:hypothetical protein